MFKFELEIQNLRYKKYQVYIEALEKSKKEYQKLKNLDVVNAISSEIKRIRSLKKLRPEAAEELLENQKNIDLIISRNKKFFVGTWKIEEKDSTIVMQDDAKSYFIDNKERLFKWSMLGNYSIITFSPERRETVYGIVKILDNDTVLIKQAYFKPVLWKRLK